MALKVNVSFSSNNLSEQEVKEKAERAREIFADMAAQYYIKQIKEKRKKRHI